MQTKQHSEAQIRKAIKPLLNVFGKLTTTEVKQNLHLVLEFNEEDKQLSASRKEIKIMQNIGNIVSHQSEQVKYYEEGYYVDKSVHPAEFILATARTEQNLEINKISEQEIKEKKEKAKKFTARKIDWNRKRERDSHIGQGGEIFVCEYEKETISEFNANTALVQHLSIIQGDGLGYDVSSIMPDGRVKLIEVKTTSGHKFTPFFMSKNEKEFFEANIESDNVFLYRVYNYDNENRSGDIWIITPKDLIKKFNFDPITYQVEIKEEYKK